MPTVNFDFRVRGASEVQRAVRATAQEASKITGRASQTAQQEQAATQATLRGAAARKRAATDTAKEVQKIEQQTTAIVQAEAAKRTSAEQAGYKQRVKSALAYQRDVERAERAATRAAEREQQARVRAQERATRTMVNRATGAGQAVVGGAISGAQAAHGQIQDARRTRAETEDVLGTALYQTGADRNEVARRMARLTAFAADRGMDPQELAQAAAAAQTATSSLAGRTGEERESRFEQFLTTARWARNTGNNVAETTRLQGFFAERRLDANTQQQLLRFAGGASQRGAVELGSVTSQALRAITSRIATAQAGLGPGATPEQRQAAAVNTFRQAFAELQVEASAGLGPRQGGNALAGLNAALQSSDRQSKMLTNIRNSRDMSAAQRRDLENSLFARDASGRSRLRTTNSLELVERFQRVAGNDATLFNNIFAGGGHGNPQSLQANWRATMGALLSPDTSGRSGIDRVRELMGENTALTAADEDRGAGVFEQSAKANMLREEQRRLNSLTSNTTANSLSNRAASWIAENPLLAAIGGPGAAALLSRGGGYLAGGAARLLAAVSPGAASVLGGSVTAAGGGAIAATVGAGLATGAVLGEGANHALAPRNKDGTRADNETIFSAQTWKNFADAIREAFSSNPVTVQISPQAAMHAAGINATGSDGTPPESRANQ